MARGTERNLHDQRVQGERDGKTSWCFLRLVRPSHFANSFNGKVAWLKHLWFQQRTRSSLSLPFAPLPFARPVWLTVIHLFQTPRDKLQCVLRCSSTIMNLLSMANERSVPAADDFMPVLIFVLIKANPLSLLSTVQYVNSFYDKRLAGEELYWWTQFCSAVEFVKTMD